MVIRFNRKNSNLSVLEVRACCFNEGGITMYKGFKVELTHGFGVISYQSLGQEIIGQQGAAAKRCLDNYINPDTGALIGDALEKDWFPVSAYDVFISHSHEDLDEVEAFVGWMQEKLGVSVFVDSAVWESADELLSKMDERYSLDRERIAYDYRRRNFSTSHVYIMLAMALVKVINQTECFMFVNSLNSVKDAVTRSPWIYAELMFANMIEKRVPKRLTSEWSSGVLTHRRKQLEIEYDVYSFMRELDLLRREDLKLWERMYQEKSCDNALDELYKLVRSPAKKGHYF